MQENITFNRKRLNSRHLRGTVFLRRVGFWLALLVLPQFGYSAALVVKGQLTFLGNSNVVVDSYNSGDPTKSTGGLYDPAKAGDNGNIYGGELPGGVWLEGGQVYGTCYLGPFSDWGFGPNLAVGNHLWQADGGEGIEAGYLYQINFLIPDVVLPDYSQYTGPTISGGPIITSNTTNQTFLDQTNLPTLASNQTIVATTNILSFETNQYPGPQPGLTTNVAWITTNDYPGDVPDLISNCTDFVIVSDDPGPQPCLSTNDTVTTEVYPGTLPGLITNVAVTVTNPDCISAVTNVTITTNYPCGNTYFTSPNIPNSWCSLATNCALIVSNSPLPTPGTLCPDDSSIVTNIISYGHGHSTIYTTNYTYSIISSYTFTTNAPPLYTTNETVDYFTNDDCAGITNYTFTFPNTGYAYAAGFSYTYPAYTYDYTQTNYDYTISTTLYQTNWYSQILSGGNYFSTNAMVYAIVTGPSTLVLPGPFPVLGDLTIAPGGSLIIYVQNFLDADAVIDSGKVRNQTGLAQNLQIYCLGSVTNLTFTHEVTFTGVLYAPSANVTVAPSATPLNFCGEMVVNSMHVERTAQFHYDEALGQGGYVILPAPALVPNLILPSPASATPFELYVNGMPGTNYAVESSTDLNNWVPLFTNVAPFSFADTNSANPGQNFYRAVYIP